MAQIFGVDSASTVTQTLIDSVTAAAGARPAFWGRYLNRYLITSTEVQLLLDNGIAINLIWNGVNGSNCTGYSNGQYAAQQAIAAAEAIGAPYSVLIWCDIEAGYAPDEEFFCGWADSMRGGPYSGTGGIYCNPTTPATYVPLLNAQTANTNAAALAIWSAEPEPGISTAANMPTWGPATCGTNKPTLWQYYEAKPGDAYGNVVDLNSALSLYGMWVPPQPFVDISPSDPDYPDIMLAYYHGLIKGEGNGEFKPDDVFTRRQMAIILARLIRKAGM